MKRKKFLFTICLTVLVMGWTVAASFADDKREKPPINVMVDFGQWIADPGANPLDRFESNPSMGGGVNDQLIPRKVTIR